MIVMGLHTLLRFSDLLRLRWDDVYDFKNGRIRKKIYLTEKKTKKTKSIELHADAIKALELYIDSAKPDAFLFENPRTKKAISRIQAYRIIRAATEAVGITDCIACHGIRKTLGYHTLEDNRHDPKIIATIVQMYNHSSLAITLRYLGITQDDMNAVYRGARLII
jgi:integrase